MQPKSKFVLGRIAATRGALDALAALGIEPDTLLERHASGDWGDLTEDDRQVNERALIVGDRLLSRYLLPDGTIYVITERAREYTTILLPEEY